MFLIPLLLFLVSSPTYSITTDDGKCNSYHSNFKLENVLGSWRLEVVVPLEPDRLVGPLVPVVETGHLPCVTVNITEAEYEGVKFLAGKSFNRTFTKNQNHSSRSKMIIRQRFDQSAGKTYDVWSMMLNDTIGCFVQILAMNHTDDIEIQTAKEPNERMQLHTVDIGFDEMENKTRHLLVQLLWGNHISAVIYSDYHKVTVLHLEKAYGIVEKLRGPQLPMRKCDCVSELSDSTSFKKRKMSKNETEPLKNQNNTNL